MSGKSHTEWRGSYGPRGPLQSSISWWRGLTKNHAVRTAPAVGKGGSENHDLTMDRGIRRKKKRPGCAGHNRARRAGLRGNGSDPARGNVSRPVYNNRTTPSCHCRFGVRAVYHRWSCHPYSRLVLTHRHLDFRKTAPA